MGRFLDIGRGAQTWWVVLLIVWGLSGAYMASQLNRGWVPHDEGALAQAGVRVLGGELPHRDFDDIYTGGLTLLNALAFRTLGINLASMRVVLFAFFLAWVPAVYYIASRFASPLLAGAVTLLAVAWSVPNYAAAMPSWYNLFFAVFGAATVLRYLETGHGRWLFVAGLCGGLSVLAKIVGLYYVAGVLLFMVFREQSLTWQGGEHNDKRLSRLYSASTASVLLGFLAALLGLFRTAFRAPEMVYFVLPVAAIVAMLLVREAKHPPGAAGTRFLVWLGMAAPFLAGVLLPIAVFLVPYAASGALLALLQDVFILPMTRRVAYAGFAAPPLHLVALPVLALLAGVLASQTKTRPDCPEVCFLTGLRNPTRTLFDFLDKDFLHEPQGRTERILQAIDGHHVRAVVLLSTPRFSGPLPPELRAQLEKLFPRAEDLGHFEVRWQP